MRQVVQCLADGPFRDTVPEFGLLFVVLFQVNGQVCRTVPARLTMGPDVQTILSFASLRCILQARPIIVRFSNLDSLLVPKTDQSGAANLVNLAP